MAVTKPKRNEVDRWTGSAIGNVSVPAENKKFIAEYNASAAKKKGGSTKARPTTKKK